MSYLDDFSPEHDPRPEHAVPWIYLPGIADVARLARRAIGSLRERIRCFDPVDAIETFAMRWRAVRELLSARP